MCFGVIKNNVYFTTVRNVILPTIFGKEKLIQYINITLFGFVKLNIFLICLNKCSL